MPRLQVATQADPTAAPEPDGRRRRSQDSRARIVAAMLDLVQDGDPAPGAEQVAARAGVGVRSVFRHFKDMDSLYREMSVAIEAEVAGVIDRPLATGEPMARLKELVGRRAAVFETISAYKRAADLQRHRSAFLEAGHAHLTERAREALHRALPPASAKDANLLESLDLLLSWEAWSRLRREQGLSPRQAKSVLEDAVGRLISVETR
jgi:AcrR family transcriptional regulator